ncbi:hypothetical protein O4J56_13985 [Nocardiopsis sp. RSe5-2]|uniref:Uncharacterized protein n=1 Tax=Nocardiopsis endophytica TaxID=3018445 RepID=A0ABT4U465_9ACTN|nr:hypothetical protein [Nocardiopsis endophytica]MDA2811747.1 hypothetical protein [Nocardiopsis endophytica]
MVEHPAAVEGRPVNGSKASAAWNTAMPPPSRVRQPFRSVAPRES